MAFTFNSTSQNSGSAATALSTRTGLYLSADATITPTDIRLGSVSIPSLAPDASQSTSTRVVIPRKLARGIYYLGAIADYLGAETERNENNNSFAGTTIQVK